MVFNHEREILYYAKCPEKSCLHDYVGESARRKLERVKHYNGRDISSHIFKHCVVADHQFVSCNDLRIVAKNHGNNKRKIAEALLI